MPEANAQTFKSALQQIEQSKDPSPLVALFAPDASADAPARKGKITGTDRIRHFWQEYLDAFQTVRSEFHTEHAAGDTAVLEWTSKGTLPTGRPIEYRGVSIVTFAGGKVKTFATYYDSAAFVTPATSGSAADPKAAVPSGATNDNGGD